MAWFTVFIAPISAHAAPAHNASPSELGQNAAGERMRWASEARAAHIVRDSWGIAHIYAHSDADAVFGAMYAQAEDDFHRIEHNYLESLGWLARAEGDSGVYSDLRQRLFVDPAQLQRLYQGSPVWLKRLMQSWADGLNFYLLRHPEVKPAVITHFEPWMALSFTEGSIGGHIENISLAPLATFYPQRAMPPIAAVDLPALPAPGGSNGFAIAPSRTASGHALLWINPHTSFYFRSELQMTSAEGLNVYGAATWGQFFVYQGFNSHNGWMHTSYGGDAVDEYAETVIDTAKGPAYRYGATLRPFKSRRIKIKVGSGPASSERVFTAYFSHHGPIVRSEGGRWIAVKLFQDPVRALEQSFLRTKTADYSAFRRIQAMRTDTSNNTVYADAGGTIAYFHGNFIPKRDSRFDFTHPVDGSDPATEWGPAHELGETITLLNPANGWIQNTNNWPFSAAGNESPKRENYPVYMWIRGENPRGLHAVQMLESLPNATIDTLISAAYDSRLTEFDVLLPPLFEAYKQLRADDPRRESLRVPIETLQNWDHRTGIESTPTTLAVLWGQELLERCAGAASAANVSIYEYLANRLTDEERLDALSSILGPLIRDFGRWAVPWGEINRYQRLTGDIVQPFDDGKPSLPVGLAPAKWGALASFDSVKPRTTRKIYGSEGNSFIAAVEFASPVHAKALMTGGESGHPQSPHFDDQARMYTEGRFRDVLFTEADVSAHAERRYHPGEP